MAVSGFRRAEARWLLDGGARASAYGEITWVGVHVEWRGRVPVAGSGIEEGDVFLEFQARPARPNEPTVILRYRNVCCRRVDVNGTHRNFRGTHIQGRDTSDDPESVFPLPDHFPELVLGDTVIEGVYERVFRAFARYCQIDASAVEWVDPPERRP